MRVEFTRPGTVSDELLRLRPWSLPNLRKVSFHNDDTWRAFVAYHDERAVGAVFFTRPDLYPTRIEVDALLILPGSDERRVAGELLRALSGYASQHRADTIAFSGRMDTDTLLPQYGFAEESVTYVCGLTDLRIPDFSQACVEVPKAQEPSRAGAKVKVTSRCGKWTGPRQYLSRHEAWCKSGCKEVARESV